MPRYVKRYEDILDVRFSSRNVPQVDIAQRSTDVYVTFNSADRLDAIASRIYGQPEFYWVILAANGYAAEFEIDPGEILRVPYPLEEVVEDIREQVE